MEVFATLLALGLLTSPASELLPLIFKQWILGRRRVKCRSEFFKICIVRLNHELTRLSNVTAVSSEARKLVGNGRSSFVVYSSQHVSSTLLENGGGTQKQKQCFSHLQVTFGCSIAQFHTQSYRCRLVQCVYGFKVMVN